MIVSLIVQAAAAQHLDWIVSQIGVDRISTSLSLLVRPGTNPRRRHYRRCHLNTLRFYMVLIIYAFSRVVSVQNCSQFMAFATITRRLIFELSFRTIFDADFQSPKEQHVI